jgi:hypothetical protein
MPFSCNNEYKVLTGKELKEFKLCFGTEIDFGTKTVRLGFFDFCSFPLSPIFHPLLSVVSKICMT